ncbi:MAG: tol-pal system protein YbgF [Pseudomonadota bacterium]
MPRLTVLTLALIAAATLSTADGVRAQSADTQGTTAVEETAEQEGRFAPFREEMRRLRDRLNILPERGQTQSADPEPAQREAEMLGAGESVELAQAGDAGIRIGALENQVRILTGQIEQLQFRIQQLEGRLGTTGAATQSQSTVQLNVRSQQPGALPQQGNVPNLPPPAPGQGVGQLAGQGSTLLGAPPQPLGQLSLGTDGQPFNLNAQDTGAQDTGLLPAPQPGAGATLQDGAQAALTTAPPSDDPRDHYDLAYGFLLRGEYDTARNAFAAFLSRFPNDALAGNATYWIGETHYQQQNYSDAARVFLDTSQNHQSSPKAPDAMLRLGQSLGRLNQRDAACSTFAELQRRYPQAQGDVNAQARQSAQGLGC